MRNLPLITLKHEMPRKMNLGTFRLYLSSVGIQISQVYHPENLIF